MKNFLPIREIIKFNGNSFEHTLSGDNGPVIILLNGFRMPLSSWEELYPDIQKNGRIFTYNRYGVGKTSKASCPQTGEEVVRSLEKVLKALDLQPPYILVAHSLGGIYANLYARLKPDEVLGVVFVDAAHPEEKQRQEEFKPPVFFRLIAGILKTIDIFFDKYQHSEDECLGETILQIEAAGDFPPIPIAVVTGGKRMPLMPQASFDVHLQCQKDLVALSPNSNQFVAEKSGHFPQITEPKIVNNAIKYVVSQISRNG